LAVVEDAGDTLHGQRNALDSGYVLDADADYGDASNQPLRWPRPRVECHYERRRCQC